jgi:hypothetical protein
LKSFLFSRFYRGYGRPKAAAGVLLRSVKNDYCGTCDDGQNTQDRDDGLVMIFGAGGMRDIGIDSEVGCVVKTTPPADQETEPD